MNLNVLTYNVLLTVPQPLRNFGQDERSKLIPYLLKRAEIDQGVEFDVVVFTELIAPAYRKKVIEGMKQFGWPHCGQILSKNPFFGQLKLVSGGVVIVSKYPITYTTAHIFERECESFDCQACKGVLYCRILKETNVFNILATHLQAWSTPSAITIRQHQIEATKLFLQQLHLPRDEPVIFCGDFNVDWYTKQNELFDLLNRIDMVVLPQADKTFPFRKLTPSLV